jgi:predicted CXXCH cytochrome family protein
MSTTRFVLIGIAWGLVAVSVSGQTVGKPEGQNPHAAVTKNTPGSVCIGCHKALVEQAVVHGPVAAESCGECHVPQPAGKPGRMTLAKGATKDNTAPLCTGCHEEVGAQLKKEFVHGPVASGDCSSCHDPHGSAFPLMLAAERTASCLVCHDSIAAAVKQKARHSPALASCGLCHDPHASEHPAQLRARGNALCHGCHFNESAPPPAGAKPLLFGRELPEAQQKLVTGAPRVALDAMGRRGHPNLGHPVAGVPDRSDQKRMLSCSSCHQPHGAAGRPLLQFGLTSVMELCLKCHK